MTPAKTYTREQIDKALKDFGFSDMNSSHVLHLLDQPTPAEPEFNEQLSNKALDVFVYGDSLSSANNLIECFRILKKDIIDLVESKVKEAHSATFIDNIFNRLDYQNREIETLRKRVDKLMSIHSSLES